MPPHRADDGNSISITSAGDSQRLVSSSAALRLLDVVLWRIAEYPERFVLRTNLAGRPFAELQWLWVV
jgi:hypothetical protein